MTRTETTYILVLQKVETVFEVDNSIVLLVFRV